MLLQENLLRTGKGKTFQWFLDALEAHCELQLRHQDPRSCPLQGQSPAEGQKCLVVRAGGASPLGADSLLGEFPLGSLLQDHHGSWARMS